MHEARRQLKLGAALSATSMDFRRYVDLARRAEQAKFDAIWVHDAAQLEPSALLAALATATRHVGLIATATTTYNEPYNIARRFASIDHISGGRAGWNLTISESEDEARNFGVDAHPAHDERYARAAEFYDVVVGLWDSWEDGALLRDKSSGIYMDRDKVHFLDHAGTHFRVKGPLNITRSPQGWPVVAHAGSSVVARRLAARAADVIVTAETTLTAAQACSADVKARAARHGRAPDAIKVMPAITPERRADELDTWFRSGGADGFVVSADDPAAFEDFTRLVVPELQRRGRFRIDYEGTTLRANLGLGIPENRNALARRTGS